MAHDPQEDTPLDLEAIKRGLRLESRGYNGITLASQELELDKWGT